MRNHQCPGCKPADRCQSLNTYRGAQLGGDSSARRCGNYLVHAEALTKTMPGAELKALDGQSHGFFWQAPEETNRIILDWVEATQRWIGYRELTWKRVSKQYRIMNPPGFPLKACGNDGHCKH